MSIFVWVMVILLVWGAVAGYVGVMIGRIVRLRDRQAPEPPTD